MWASFPVKRERRRAFAPLSKAIFFSLRSHASQPYVSSEHMADLYIFIFKRKEMFALNTCLSWPIRVVAMPTRRFISCRWQPSAENTEPRYVKWKTFSKLSPSQHTASFAFCASISLLVFTLPAAHVPVKFCSFSCRSKHERMCILTPRSLLQGMSHSGQRAPRQLWS